MADIAPVIEDRGIDEIDIDRTHVPGVHEAVEHIVAAERAEAEAQAQKLRAELAEIEARLAELRDAG